MKRKKNTATVNKGPSGKLEVSGAPVHRKAVCILAIGIMILFTPQSHAEIATDGTVGPALSLTGPDFRIGYELGTSIGGNLFHSFDRFNIHPGESATFTGPDTINTVISRVTGGSGSTIDGLLRSEIGTADFYFINPAGVIFGPNARVDVPAAFHVSTADDLRFTDRSVFSATCPDTSTLTAAAPESFGYLGHRTADIVVNGSKLDFVPGSIVSLSGGEIIIQGNDTDTSRITVPNGELRLYAAGNAADNVPLTGALKAGGGSLELTHTRIETSGGQGGRLLIGAGEASLTEATLAADTTGETAAGDLDNVGMVTVSVSRQMEVLNGSSISSNTHSTGHAGTITIEAGNLRIDAQGNSFFTGIRSLSIPGATGDAGTVIIRVNDLLEVLNGGGISSSTHSSGDAGKVEIDAEKMHINGQAEYPFTGIASSAAPQSSGNAGSVTIRINDLIEILNGGVISSDTWGTGDAGGVEIQAEKLQIDGQGANGFTGISSSAEPGSSRNAGTVTIRVNDLIEILNGGVILSDTWGAGDAGGVEIQAGRLHIDRQGANSFTGIASSAEPGSTRNAGTVSIRVADLMEVLNGGVISSDTWGTGDAGGVAIHAGRLRIDREGGNYYTRISSDAITESTGNAGSVTVEVEGLLEILGGAVLISSDTSGEGNAGAIIIDAGGLRIDAQGTGLPTSIRSLANSGSLGKSGMVTIRVAELMEVLNGAQISSSIFATGDGGEVKIEAGGLLIDGQGSPVTTGIFSSAQPGSAGKSGTVTIKIAGLMELVNGGAISSETYTSKDAGEVTIHAGRLIIDRAGGSAITGISSAAGYESSGNAGKVTVEIEGLLEILGGAALISSDTSGEGNAGAVIIEAGNLRIDAQGTEFYTGVKSEANSGSAGDAGTVTITVADLLEIVNGGKLSSSTYSSGDARSVEINAGRLRIDGLGSPIFTGIASTAERKSSGNAGTVTIRVTNLMELVNGGAIACSTFETGDAGNVAVEAGRLRIDEQGAPLFTGIVSSAEPDSSGNAGTVKITVAGLLEVLNGGKISSNTFAGGNAGNVKIYADEMLIDGQKTEGRTYIASASRESAQGYAGNLDIEVEKLTIRNGGAISIETHQSVSEENLFEAGKAHLFIKSPAVILDQGAKISAQSTGNVPAAAIGIEADHILIAGNSSITTSANEANGGAITLQGEIIDLRDSLITSSVEGQNGDGGDITIKGADSAKVLILEGGFIQANAPAGARGGDIFIDAEALIPEGGTLEVGGQARQTFTPGSGRNIIQAAAPGGEQGTIHITSPELDISASLVNLDAGLIETIRLAADPCRRADSAEESSLVFAGSGGVPIGPDQHIALFFDEYRLDTISAYGANKQRPGRQSSDKVN